MLPYITEAQAIKIAKQISPSGGLEDYPTKEEMNEAIAEAITNAINASY